MDASSHLAHVSQYQNYQGSTSRPSMSRSQTTGSTGPNEIDFSIPDVRPGLARIGRRLTEMSENFLYDDVKSSDSETKRPSTPSMSTSVPFMGDEPVFCPFCDKPLPPALLLQHMTSAPDSVPNIKANPRLAGVESSSMAKTTSAPEGSGSAKQPSTPAGKPHLNKQPSGISASRPTSPMSAAQLAANVKEADSVDSAAGKLLLDTDTLRKWSKIAGVELDLPAPTPEVSASKKEDTQPQTPAKPFPKLAPPPEDSSRSSSRNSSKFSLFGKGKNKPEDDEDDESDDDLGGGGGYARLDAPASPERVERELPSLKKRSVEEGDASVATETSTETGQETKEKAEPVASDAEVRELLKEVLIKINEVSKSHASVLHSHSTLLTTLKIARSNLAMAEANAEMLEEQLKRQTTQTVKPPASTGPARLPTSAMGPPPAPKPAPIRTTTTGPGAGEGQIAKTEAATPRRSVEASSSARPQSIQIPSSTNPRTPMSASSDSSKGMFGSFWNRNKDKVGEFMSSLPDLTPTAERSSFDFAKSPTNSAVPYGAAIPDYRSAPGLNRSKTVHGRAGEIDSLARSSSYTNVQTAKPPADPYMQELSRLRQLDRSSQQKIEAITKELAEMKKGKIEMEAELENLSQALFEEANKMVADEKKRRVEMEEALKEVKAEREALRDTIKVLGGQVESGSSKGDSDELQVPDNGVVVAASPDFAPRDLDKHYEALRKSIHHVADDTEWNEEEEEGTSEEATDPARDAERPTTPVKARRHSLPDIASPEPPKAPALHDPWADSETSRIPSSTSTRGTSTSPNRRRSQLKPLTLPSDEFGPGDTDTTSPRSTSAAATASESGSRRSSSGGPVSPKAEKLDALDEMMEQMQADIELESPKKEKKNPL